MKFIDQMRRYARSVGGIAPAQRRSIVTAHTREARNLRVNIRPIQAGRRDAGFQNYNGAAGAGLDQMHPSSIDFHQAARRGIITPIGSAALALIQQSSAESRNQSSTNDDCEKPHRCQPALRGIVKRTVVPSPDSEIIQMRPR